LNNEKRREYTPKREIPKIDMTGAKFEVGQKVRILKGKYGNTECYVNSVNASKDGGTNREGNKFIYSVDFATNIEGKTGSSFMECELSPY